MITTQVGPNSADIFAAYQSRIRQYILGMVHDPDDADDLTQDVFIQVHRKLGSLREQDAVVSWLYRIATHVCYDRFRRSSRRPGTVPLEEGAAESIEPGADGIDVVRLDRVIERSEMSTCVRKYIEDLSPSYRQVIALHDLEELTNPEIAEMLGISLDTVKIRLHRARRKLEGVLNSSCDFSCDEQGVLVCEPAGPACGVPSTQVSELRMYPAPPDRLLEPRGRSDARTPE